MPVTLTCDQCGTTFQRSASQAAKVAGHYCSRACMGAHQRTHPTRPRLGIVKICRVCGAPFYVIQAKRDVSTTCSQACSYKVPRARPTAWTDAELRVLREFYPTEGASRVAVLTGRPHGSVQSAAQKHGIRVEPAARKRIAQDHSGDRMRTRNPMRTEAGVAAVKAWRAAHPEQVAAIHAKLVEGVSRLHKHRPSGLEFKLRTLLDEFGVEYEASVVLKPHFVVDVRIGSLIIEADGDYWHGHPRLAPFNERQRKQQTRDRSRDVYLRACGYSVARIWESDMSRETVRRVLDAHGLRGDRAGCAVHIADSAPAVHDAVA